MSAINFRPWKGDRYREGLGGRRVLLLGESHYHDVSDEIDGDPEFTNRVVRKQFQGEVRTYAFFTKIARAVLGPDRRLVTNHDKHDFWHQVAFYNYVQRSVGRLTNRPTLAHWKDSEPAFFEVLDELEPEVVIAFGYTLWDNLPNIGEEGPRIADPERPRTWIYPYRGGSAITYSTRHPSRAFNWADWHSRLKQVMSLPLPTS